MPGVTGGWPSELAADTCIILRRSLYSEGLIFLGGKFAFQSWLENWKLGADLNLAGYMVKSINFEFLVPICPKDMFSAFPIYEEFLTKI